MAKKITELTAETTPASNDLFVMVDTASNTTKKVSVEDIFDNIPAGSVETADIAEGASTPSKRSGGFKTGIIASSTFSTTGNKSVTGLGFRPKCVRFTILINSTSDMRNAVGYMNEAGEQYVYATFADETNQGASAYSTSSCIGFVSAGSTTFSMNASYVSMDADGFTINVSAASGFAAVAYEAYA